MWLDDLPPARHHGELQRVADDVYYIEGTVHMFGLKFPRGMTVIVCDGSELALVNAVRLSPEGEQKLLALGRVAHVVRIGTHDEDNAYYVRKFGARFWAFTTVEHAHNLQPDMNLKVDELPLRDSRIVIFPNLPPSMAEAAILLLRPNGNILVTCDSVQSHDPVRGNWLAKLTMPFMGFKGKCIFGPVWGKEVRKQMPDPTKFEKDMALLRELDFAHLLSGHGSITDGTAKSTLVDAYARTFPGA